MKIANSARAERSPVEVGVALLLGWGPRCGGGTPDNPQILITQRRPGTPYAAYWEFPGGKAEPGEAPEACVRRELREELGVAIEIQTVLPPIIHTYDHATVRIHPAVCRLAEGSPEPRALDVAAWEWRGLASLPWDQFLPANVRVVTALMRHLENVERGAESGRQE